MGKMDEIILVAKRDKVFDNEKEHFQGAVNKNVHPYSIGKIMKALGDNIETMRRGDAEEDATYKQPIPYAVIKQGDKYFGYTRLTGGGEARLHGAISLGVGGHMNEIEGMQMDTFDNVLLENLRRELNEELNIDYVDGGAVRMDTEIIGLINDDTNEVGRVHLGILAFINVSENAIITVAETDQLEGRWYTAEELKENYERLENWSKIVADIL